MKKLTHIGFFALTALASGIAQAGGNYVELGAGYLGGDNGLGRKYSGMDDDSAAVIASFGITEETENGTEVTVEGQDLGLDTRRGLLEVRNQGQYRLRIEGRSLPHLQARDAMTKYAGTGSDNIIDDGNNHKFDLYTRRDSVDVQADVFLSPDWKLTSSFSRENKEGLQLVGTGRSFPGAIRGGVGAPVDQVTDTYGVGLSFVGMDSPYAFNVNYAYSNFDNKNETLRVHYESDGAPDFSNVHLAPDNHAHILTANGVYRLSQTGRLSMNGRRSHMRQNQDFSDFSYSGNNAAPDPGRSRVDAKVDQTYLSLAYTDRYTRQSNVRARYTYQERDNRTPVTTGRHGASRPYSSESHKLDLESGYRLTSSTRLIGNYAYETVNRKDDLLEVDDLDTHSIMGKVAYRRGLFNGGLSAEYKRRRGDNFDASLIGKDNDDFRRYFLADLNETRLRLNGSYQFSQAVSGSAEVNVYEQDFLDGTYGVQERKGGQILADLNYQINSAVNLFTHASASQGKGEQVNNRSGANDIVTMDAKDTHYTFGFGSQWSVPSMPMTVTVDYSYSNAKSKYDGALGSGNKTDLDDAKTRIHYFSVDATYRFTDRMELKGMYSYERTKLADFALTDNLDDLTNHVYLGDPNVSSHFIGVAVRYQL